MKKENMMELNEAMRKVVLEMTAHMPEGKNRANGVLMLISDDLTEQLMKLSLAGACTELDRDTAVNLASALLCCKREIETICALQLAIHLPRTGETYPEP